ncbi:2-octaprenyl-6-methoxyphenyl hydroxylase [Paroceanicella profunda]|uniref:2-octaprenyl-6-methoxyphenyl hydroxylase n=1 Tax=Paroceanicella profunda TaxID=2579971 RepID=A0A5B8FR96_9RHOB|nr:FAD-dependent monooxygenase [Paroceanicella profunda]QDL91236.1 2-octaprenyl-6-methoxyphenyl hydroxylase [Paroceanicella profunda]
MKPDADVLIAGGGLAGCLMALALARGGLSSVLCDSLPAETRGARSFDGRAYAIAASCTRLLDGLGLWERLQTFAEPMRDIVVSDGRIGAAPSPFFLHFDHREGDSGPFAWMVEDRHLRRALLDAVADAPLIDHRAPVRVTDHETTAAGASLTLSDGTRLTGRMIIACDGRRSAIAARAGIRHMRRDYGQTGLVCAVAHDRPHEGVAHEYFLPAGPFAILPLPHNRVSLVWTETPANARRIIGLGDADFHDELRTRFGDFLGETRLEGQRYSYPLTLSLAEDYVRPRLALLGDAAHGIHPLAGQGLNLALKDVAALAEVLVDGARLGEDIGSLLTLERYQSWRRFDATAVALACDGLNRLFSNDNPLLRPLRDIGLGLVGRLPAARRFFMREAAGSMGELPRLMRGRPL